MPPTSPSNSPFSVELIRPSRYDVDGYVIQWWKSVFISNSLACLYSLAKDAAERRVLGDDVEMVVSAYDEGNQVLPVDRMIERIKGSSVGGVVCLVGVQTNQFVRAADLARRFRSAGVQVVIGGFHVSGNIAMLPELPAEMQELVDLGVSLFAGEAEGQLDMVLRDAFNGKLKPVYNVLGQLPDIAGSPIPYLPPEAYKRVITKEATADISRGCPFDCSFCSIINVQGRKPRSRTADDIEKMVLAQRRPGRSTSRFFFTDDNFARNPNWESIIDRLIELREKGVARAKFAIQADVQAHKIPRFMEKVARAGCRMVFLGVESVNPENLAAVGKRQNQIEEYREMLEAWHEYGITTMGGYILGFDADTPESIEKDLETIKSQMPIDILMFNCLVPLPGSRDHRDMVQSGAWVDPDLNKFNGQFATVKHPHMSAQEWEEVFGAAWDIYYSPKHVRQVLHRAVSDRISSGRLIGRLFAGQCAVRVEGVHPFEFGVVRRKIRTTRRHGMPLESPFVFYPRRLWEFLRSAALSAAYGLRIIMEMKLLTWDRDRVSAETRGGDDIKGE